MSGECEYCGEHPVDGCAPDCKRPIGDDTGHAYVRERGRRLLEKDRQPTAAPEPARGDDLAQAAGSLFSQFCAYGDDVPVGVGSKLTVGDVRRAVRERYVQPTSEAASDGAKGADEVLWSGVVPHRGLWRCRRSGVWEQFCNGWRYTELPSDVATHLAALLHDSLAANDELRELVTDGNAVLVAEEVRHQETKRALAEMAGENVAIAAAKLLAERRATEAERRTTTATKLLRDASGHLDARNNRLLLRAINAFLAPPDEEPT